MRPRPDAAENLMLLSITPRSRGASMRPRPDAAENGDTTLDVAGLKALQ